jgi:hypothetical protein
MLVHRLTPIALAAAIALPAQAQSTLSNVSRPIPAAASAVRAITLPEGTEFSVITAETVSSKTAAEGDRISLKVEENVVVNGQTLIARGSAVRGVVASVEKAGRMGKGGKLNLRVESAVAVDGQHVALRATKAKEGDDKTGSTVALTVLFGPIGLLKKGKDATYPEGTRITVYTDQALTIMPASAGQ